MVVLTPSTHAAHLQHWLIHSHKVEQDSWKAPSCSMVQADKEGQLKQECHRSQRAAQGHTDEARTDLWHCALSHVTCVSTPLAEVTSTHMLAFCLRSVLPPIVWLCITERHQKDIYCRRRKTDTRQRHGRKSEWQAWSMTVLSMKNPDWNKQTFIHLFDLFF